MRTSALLAPAVTGALLLACDPDSPPRSLAAPDLPEFDVLALTPEAEAILAEAGIEVLQPTGPTDQAATGGVVLTTQTKLAFSALLQGGEARGQFQVRPLTPDGQQVVHGRVTCLVVSGTSAVIGGVVTHSTVSTISVDQAMTFLAEDRGESGNDGDFASNPARTRTPCRFDREIPLPEPVIHGNLQVHDGRSR